MRWGVASAQTDKPAEKKALTVAEPTSGEGSAANLARREQYAASAEADAAAKDKSFAYDRSKDAGTCALYVGTTITKAGGQDIRVKKADGTTGFPSAAEWATGKVTGWRKLGNNESPQRGDTGSVKMDPSLHHGATGHVVIVVSNKGGHIMSVASHPGSIGYEGPLAHSGITWQRYIGD